jgi:hypothetical protein
LVAVVWRGSDKPKSEVAGKELAPQPSQQIKEDKNAVAPEPEQAVNPATQPNVKRSPHLRELQARNSKTTRADGSVANHASSEVATDFLPLGYLNPASLQDGGQIVRVEVPRTTMASFGLPVNMDRYNERVKADVLVGVDGVPHAIRFVQDKKSQ